MTRLLNVLVHRDIVHVGLCIRFYSTMPNTEFHIVTESSSYQLDSQDSPQQLLCGMLHYPSRGPEGKGSWCLWRGHNRCQCRRLLSQFRLGCKRWNLCFWGLSREDEFLRVFCAASHSLFGRACMCVLQMMWTFLRRLWWIMPTTGSPTLSGTWYVLTQYLDKTETI